MPQQEKITLDPESAEYAREVAVRLRETLGDKLVGVYLHGSAVLGDFVREQSDIDVVAVSDEALTVDDKRAVAERLSAESLPSPVGGLEFHIVDRHTLHQSPEAPPFELHIASKGSASFDRVVDGRGHGGDTDLVMHFAVLRERGVNLSGPPASEIFPRVPRERLLRAFEAELRWAREHASPAYQVLNACRACRFLEEDVLCSKLEGGEWGRRNLEDAATIEAAIAHRKGGSDAQPDPMSAGALVDVILGRLELSG